MAIAFEEGRPGLFNPRCELIELQANSIADEFRPAVCPDDAIDAPKILRREVQVQTCEVEWRASHAGKMPHRG